MAASRTLELIVRAKDETSKVLKDISGTLDGMRTKFNSTLSGIASAVFSLQGAIAGAGIGFFFKSFIDAAKEVEGYRIQLRILTGDVERGNALFKEAADYASKVTYEYKDIIGVVTQLRGVIKGSDQEVMKWTRLVGDVAAATGFDVRTTTEQISRMYSAGAQSAELFKERGKLAMLGFQTGVSYTVEKTRKMLMEAWEGPKSAIKGAAFELANTWDGLFSMISDKWFQFRTVMMEQSGIFNYLKAWVKTYIDYLDKMVTEDKLASWAKSTGEVVISVFEKMAMAAGYLGTAFQGWGVIFGMVGRSIAWVGEMVATGAEQLGKFAEYAIGMLEKFAELQQDLANFSFTPEWLKANMLENAIRIQGTIKGWRIELKEGDKEILLFRQAMQELKSDSFDLLDSYINQIPVHEKIRGLLIQVRDLAKQIGDAQGAKTPGVDTKEQVKMAKQSELLKNAMERMRADMDLELAMVNAQLNQRLISLGEYYDKRRDMILERSNAEIELQRNLLKTEEIAADPNKVADIKTKIYELEKKQIADIIKLEEERRDKQKKELEDQLAAQAMLADIRGRAMMPLITSSAGGLQSTFDKELRDIDKRHRDEIEMLKQKTREISDIEDAQRNQRLEKDRLLADQQRRMHEFYLTQATDFTKNLEAAFGDLYEATGKKVKAFFYLQKAASIATTIIQTYESATKAFNAMASIPYVGPALGYAAAAAAIAAGMARVAVISSTAISGAQGAAEGGEIKGYSPTKKSDNIPIRATAGEFMQPVDTVQHYGLGIMEGLRKKKIPKSLFEEGLRQKLIPKSLLEGFQPPSISAAKQRTTFAAGGQVTGAGSATSDAASNRKSQDKIEDKLTINNILDPALFAQYIASVPGEKQLLNFINNNSYQVRAMILR